jgi:hypothetical protein
MNNSTFIQNKCDALIASHMLKGDSTIKIAIIIGKTERTVQAKWKKIIARLHCKSTAQAAGKIASLCVRKQIPCPPTVEDLLNLFN